ncbi:MAG TPA: tetratricopeptide repeat protein [Candidatus Acidoferrum sp.]|nr:tetratricopeptide repeat protein [Candidatus Acidoferrum sp.]
MNERMRVALLLAVAMLVYGNTLLNGFTFDDDPYILRNPTVTNLSIKGLFVPTRASNIFRPVSFATFALNLAVGGGHPFGFHLFNLLLHAAVTLLLYLVLLKLLEGLPQGATVAWVAALLFAVHPIHTEDVASIVGRFELLAVGFLLAAWLFHLRDRPILMLVCFVLALMSKESAVAFVPLALAGDYACGKLKPVQRYGWIAGVGVVYIALLWKIQGGRFGPRIVNFLDNPLVYLSPKLRILNALRVAWKYAGLHVYPATLSCDYSYNAILLYAGGRHLMIPAVAALLVLALWIWTMWAKRSEWFLGGAIYLCGFAATANLLVPTGTIMGERLAYLPSAGFCLLAALLWVRLEKHQRKLAWAVLAIVVAALATRTVVRNQDWRDNFSLFSAGEQAVPRSAKMHFALGGEYMNRGQWAAALAELQTALRIYPDYPEAMEFSGIVESQLGHDQEALNFFEKGLSMTPRDNPDYDFRAVNLAAQLLKLGKSDDALKVLNEDIANSPGYSRAWSNRAVIHFQRGELASAREDAQTALRLDPANTQAQNLLKLLSAPAPVTPQH